MPHMSSSGSAVDETSGVGERHQTPEISGSSDRRE